MALTSAGRVLADEASDLLARIQRAETRVRRSTQHNPAVRIAFVSAALNGALTRLLGQMKSRAVELTEMTTPEQVDALSAGRIDLGLLHPPIRCDDFSLRSLGRDPFVAAVPECHPLAKARRISFSQIAAEAFVLFPPEQGPSLMGAIERLAFENGERLSIAATAPRVHSQLAIIAGGVGIGLVTRSTANTLTFQGVSFIEISDTADRLFIELAIAGDSELISAMTD